MAKDHRTLVKRMDVTVSLNVLEVQIQEIVTVKKDTPDYIRRDRVFRLRILDVQQNYHQHQVIYFCFITDLH